MSKNVVVVSSSPRKAGNSEQLCDQFVLGAKEKGHRVEKIALRDKIIHYCTGCGSCMGNPKGCFQKDDMADLLDKLIAADVIVMATPVYFYTMAAQMKTLIDRCCSRYTEITNKEFYFILTAADTDKQAMERTLEGFRGFTACLTDAREMGAILGTGAWNIGDIKTNVAMKQAYETGKRI